VCQLEYDRLVSDACLFIAVLINSYSGVELGKRKRGNRKYRDEE
jgi:hypothetical protein